jgi:O-antigen/teichoic acid export membrane protein
MGSTAICASLAAVLWFEGTEVIRVWTRDRLTPDIVLLRLLLLQLALQAPWQASSLITAASSRHSRLSYAYLWSSVAALGIAILLIGWVGLWALPIGAIAAEALVCYHFVIHDTCSKIGEAYGRFASRLWLYVGFGFGFAILIAWGAHNLAFGPVPLRWGEVSTATLICTGGLLWMVGLGVDDRRQMRSMLQHMRSS